MALELRQVAITLAARPLIAAFSLRVAAGDVVTVMGASGSGKSSLLGYIAGDLEPPLSGIGQVLVGGADVTSLAPEARRIGRLFQDDLLFPHLTVAENLLFGVPRGGRTERISRVAAALADVGLAAFGDRPPHTLSGGQRARVALMRTLLAEPTAVLLDEPFNKLDAELRAQIRHFVFRHLAERGVPALLVTHDPADAPAGGRVLKLRDGVLGDA